MLRGRIIENGKYVVFNNGSIWIRNWSRTGKPKRMKQRKRDDGYLSCCINGKHVLAHRLIAQCFLSNPNRLPEVNHINEIKTDNRIENLEWCDRKYNNNYGTRNERAANKNSISHTNHPKLSKPVYQYTKDGQFVSKYPSLGEVERQLGYDNSHIASCCRGKQKTSYGYIWSFTPLTF